MEVGPENPSQESEFAYLVDDDVLNAGAFSIIRDVSTHPQGLSETEPHFQVGESPDGVNIIVASLKKQDGLHWYLRTFAGIPYGQVHQGQEFDDFFTEAEKAVADEHEVPALELNDRLVEILHLL
jgi:hypothetical protein